MRSIEAIKKAQKKYEKTGVIKRKVLKLHEKNDKDKDILDELDKKENVNKYLKNLIGKDIMEEK